MEEKHQRSQVSPLVGDPSIPVTRSLMGWTELAKGGGLRLETHLQDPLLHWPGLQLEGIIITWTRKHLPKLLCAGDIGFGERFGEPAR